MSNGRVPTNDLRQGEDLIDLTTFAARRIGRFEAVSSRTIEQADGTVITPDVGTGGGTSVFVAGVTGLGAADFLLG